MEEILKVSYMKEIEVLREHKRLLTWSNNEVAGYL